MMQFCREMQKPKFQNGEATFQNDLKRRIHQYFEENRGKFTGNTRLYSKAIFLVSSMVLLYAIIVFAPIPLWLSAVLCVILGLNTAAIGFNVMHDGSHGSFSSRKGINRFAALSLNLLGGSEYLWNHKHNVIHHSYTNIDGVDDDIDNNPWFRLSPTQKRRWFHRFQHIYWIILYSVMYFFWIFYLDLVKYFTGKIGDIAYTKMKPKDHLGFWITKVTHIALFMVIPIYSVGFGHFLIGYIIFSSVCGFTISTVFQLAHIVNETEFPSVSEETGRVENEWALHQIATTANFATKSRVVNWFTGGLNFQVEHHLFPKISHIHYPAISKIVKQACKEYNLNYVEFPTLWSAVISHVSYLRKMGRPSFA
jgi:linoleoyl-CoA desaturase